MATTNRISTGVVLALALAAASAPGASARPVGADPSSAAGSQASTAVRSNPDQQTVNGVTANRTSAAVYSRQEKSIGPSTAPSTTAGIPKAIAPPVVVRLQAPASGFDWGDAGIGAAGGFALSMIGLGGALAVSQRHTRRARTTT
jgi:hypothetical protein